MGVDSRDDRLWLSRFRNAEMASQSGCGVIAQIGSCRAELLALTVYDIPVPTVAEYSSK